MFINEMRQFKVLLGNTHRGLGLQEAPKSGDKYPISTLKEPTVSREESNMLTNPGNVV